MARNLRDALPRGNQAAGAALRAHSCVPGLSPRLSALDRDAFVLDAGIESTVDHVAHRADTELAALDLGDDSAQAA